ncbi:hypothetical protein [Cystobacter ferrugineus]|uniref:Lipoprotein n=1 Tax=Cystobacter ferrugineus TaxID=83449 RepID=A0A1L9BBM9_9BACT|nr:hypothetical protein [Cystobacter ferrugineus]OJH39603.1 hypothetical protein BON30_19130 [Cystobacter ferrugineus]
MKRSMLLLCLPLATFALGCGPAGQQFHGSYSGPDSLTVSITGRGSATGSGKMSLRISEGIDSDIVIMDSSGTCALPADVEGNVATLRAGVTCTGELNGVSLSLTFTSGTAVLTGSSIQLDSSGTLTYSADGQSYPGTFVRNNSLTRIAK